MRRNSFDLVRLLAAAMVLYAHSWAVADADNSPPLNTLHVFGVGAGLLAVVIFFSVSGYLITASWQAHPSFAAFAWKRCLRLLPALLPLAVVLVLVQQSGVFDGNPHGDRLDPPLWSLPVEAYCYLLVALLGIAGAVRKPTPVFALFAVLLLAQAWDLRLVNAVIGDHQHSTSVQTVVTAFVGGMLMHWVPRRPLYALAALVLLVGHKVFPHPETAAALGVPYLVIYGAERFTLSLKHDISYGLYIWGWPVQQAVVAIGILAPVVIFPLTLAVTGLVATVSWCLVERPALRLKRVAKWSSPPRAVLATRRPSARATQRSG